MRFLVFSDLHLDHDFADLGPEQAATRRADLRGCLDRLLALADAHEVDAILSAGDLYEHRHLRPGTASFLVDRLGQAGRPVFLAPGDEDPHTPDSLYATTTWPANVHVFDHDLLVPVELAEGVRLWGAAHLRPTGTTGFLDGFQITDDVVDLALFHGSEVGSPAYATAPVVAPFRAEQVERAGLTHAFVGHAHAAVDAPWHTSPGAPDPLDGGEPDPRGAVIVDVAPDGSLRRRRFGVAASPVHQVTIDLTDAASTDEVLERMIASVEDLQGTVHVHLHGQPAPDVVVHDDEITSWSTGRLEIVVAPRPAAPPPPREHPPAEVVLDLTAAPVDPPDLGGLDPDTVAAHLQALRARPAELEPHAAVEAPDREAPPARREPRLRTVARAAAAVLTLSAAIGLLLLGDTVAERALPVAAIVMVVVVLVSTRRGEVEDTEPEDDGARARAALLHHIEVSAELARARHAATTALRQAGLPTDPDELAAVLEAARDEAAGRGSRPRQPVGAGAR